MKKTLKVLVVINVTAFVIAGVLFALAQYGDPHNGFNGMLFVYPLVILIVSFIIAVLVIAADKIDKIIAKLPRKK